MATKNASATLEADMTGSANAFGLVKITSSQSYEADMTGSALAYGLVTITPTMEADMTGSGAGYPIGPASATLEADMTGSSPTGDTTQARALATLEADMTGSASGDSHQARAFATLEADMTGTATAYDLVPDSAKLSGASTFTPSPEWDIGKDITLATSGLVNGIPYLQVAAAAALGGSSTFSVSSIVPGAAVLLGSNTAFFTPHISRAAPLINLIGFSTFAATPVGTMTNGTFTQMLAFAVIGGQLVQIEAGTLQIKGVLAQRKTAQFTITDTRAQYNFIEGMYCVVRDTYNNRLFSGFVSSNDMTKPTGGGATVQHNVQASDARYVADKRTAATTYTNQTAGFMFTDLLENFLTGEGLFIGTGKNILTAALSTPLSNTVPAGMTTVSASVMRADPLSLWGSQDAWVWTPNGASTFEELLVLLADGSFSDNTQYTCSFYARCLYGTPQIRYEGYESNPSTGFSATTGTLSANWQRFSVTFTTPNPIPNRGHNSLGLRIDTGSNTYSIPIQIAGIQIEAHGSATAWEFGGAATISAGPTIVAHQVDYKYVADELDLLAQYANFQWYCDQFHRVFFQNVGAVAAPFNPVSHIHMIAGSVTVTNASPLYRNRQIIRGITSVTASQTETRKGDGTTRAFTFSYPLNQKPSAFTVNGVTKTLGIKGVDTGKDFYWAKADPVIAQDTGGTLLTSSDTISMTYIGQYPSVILSDDSAAQTLRASIEGFTTGIVEEVETISSINSDSEGFQVAASFLQRFTPQAQRVVFDTYFTGLVEGMTALISIPEMNIVNQSMLIEEVDTTDGDPNLVYTITCLIGPFDTNWVAFFKKLAKPPNYVDANGGSENSTLALTQNFTAAYATLSATWSVTVTSVPFPSPTEYPSTGLYPG